MESIQLIKRRLKSVQNTGQITKAMELVAATKMRRSQEIALASRPYSFTSLDILSNLSQIKEIELPPLLQKSEVKKTIFIVITSDKGLAGSFNASVIKRFEEFMKKENIDLQNSGHLFLAIGQKAANYLEKIAPVERTYLRVGDYTTIEEVKPIAEFLLSGYLDKKWGQAMVFSTHFRSALKQEVVRRQILPIDYDSLKQTLNELIPETGRYAHADELDNLNGNGNGINKEYLIEPSPEEVLEGLAHHLMLMQIYHLILEANASEHAARRMAMKNASDNALELADDLTLEYNKSRQAGITKEILEISAGAESLK